MTLRRALTVCATLLVLFFVSLFYLNTVLNALISLPESGLVFNIKRGAGTAQVFDELARQRILNVHPLIMKGYARLTASKEGSVKAGEYELTQGLTHKALLALFRSGKVIQYALTFPEGYRCAEWLRIMEGKLPLEDGIGPDCEGLMDKMGFPGESAEGQLYPDTYHYTRDDTALSVLTRARQRMQKMLASAWSNRQEGLPFTNAADALVLASIVEKETGAEADRGTIASVFVNRLNKGMKLQSDPTVIYGLKDFDGNLQRKHLKAASPYNTYVIRGLPPTPISNPGSKSIYAVLNPPETDYLYFVAKGNGRSYFSKTLSEHNEAVRQYQILNRREDYQSRPGID